MNWYHVEARSKTSGPSWRTLGIPDNTLLCDALIVCAEDPSVAERLALGYVEERQGRVCIVIHHVTPVDPNEVVIPVTTTLG